MGGSESRFICKPLTTDKYLMVTAPHDNHQKVVLGPRDPEDRYQKVVFKTDDNCLNIRFDNHPQPYVCATQSGDKWTLKMERSYDSDQAGHFQWKLVILGKRKTDRGRWKVKNGYKLNWMNTKHHSLKAVLINSAANMVLSYDCVSNELRLVKVSKGNVHTLSDEAVWELECVDHNYNSTQATIPAGVFVPFGAVAVIGEAAATALPPAQLLPFFEYLRLLAPMEDETDGAVTEYSDLPSCDVDALYRPSSGCGTPAPLIFWLTCGFCPVGLFRLLITHLSSPHVPSELKWELCSGDLFRNKATFRVGRDQDELTLIARPMMYEVWINREDDEGSAIPLTQVCSHVRSTIDKAITTVKSSFDSILTIDHRIGFYCQRPACGTTAGGHPAVFKDIGDARPVCLSADKASPLTPEQRMWLHVEKVILIHGKSWITNCCSSTTGLFIPIHPIGNNLTLYTLQHKEAETI